ncbi:MAG: DUF465 domain-containing protein [Nitrospirota bacterium]
MRDDDVSWIEHLRKTNREYVDLERRHLELERELGDLVKRRVLTTDEEVRKKNVQKEKLATKDRMNDILRHTRHARMAS